MFPEADWANVVSSWRLGDTANTVPIFAARAAALSVGLACRITTGSQKRTDAIEAQETADKQLQAQLAAAQLAHATANATDAPTIAPKDWVNQEATGEVALMSEKDIQEASAEYERRLGGPPDEEFECSPEQLTSLRSILGTKLLCKLLGLWLSRIS